MYLRFKVNIIIENTFYVLETRLTKEFILVFKNIPKKY